MAKNKFEKSSSVIEVHITPETRKILNSVDTRFITESYYINQAIEQSASNKKLKDLRIPSEKETIKEENNDENKSDNKDEES